MKLKPRLSFICVLFVFSGAVSSCSSIPEPSENEINLEAKKAYNEVRAKSKISNNKDWTAMVNRVASRIAKASGENFEWEWMLIEDPQVNAWCMPGGKIAVYTGIMPVLKTEAALAAVLGHEVAHATKRHGKQQYARAVKGNMIGLAVGAATALGGQYLCKNSTCKTLTSLGGAAASLAIVFFDRKYSREDETEADHFGQMYMAKAGYEPSEAIQLWDRMAAASGGNAPPEFLSTHPSEEHRRENLKGWLPHAEDLYSQSPQKFGIGEKIQ